MELYFDAYKKEEGTMKNATPLITWSTLSPVLVVFTLSDALQELSVKTHRIYFSFSRNECADVSLLESVGERGAKIVQDISHIEGVRDIALQPRVVEVGVRPEAEILDVNPSIIDVFSKRCDVSRKDIRQVSSPNATLRQVTTPHRRTRRVASSLRTPRRRR